MGTSTVAAVGKIFGMFDKVDDIIYEPVKLLCDVMRQPLKQVDAHNERVNDEHKQKLAMDLKKFEEDIELDKKRREAEISMDQKKAEIEIQEMIRDNDLQRRKDMVELEMRYRKEMAEAATQLSSIMANMQVETRGKIISLYTEKEKEYVDMQEKYKLQMYDSVKMIKSIFPDESGNKVAMDEMARQLSNIAEKSANFSKLMNEDMKNVFGIIDDEMKEINGLATKYFQPAQGNQPALTQSVVDSQ